MHANKTKWQLGAKFRKGEQYVIFVKSKWKERTFDVQHGGDGMWVVVRSFGFLIENGIESAIP